MEIAFVRILKTTLVERRLQSKNGNKKCSDIDGVGLQKFGNRQISGFDSKVFNKFDNC